MKGDRPQVMRRWNAPTPLRRTATLGAALVLMTLGACTSPTPYQPVADGFGYAEQQLEDNRYRVTFAGNADTSRDTVETYLLYRAAELTVDGGFDYFKVANQNIERSTRYFGTVDPFLASSFDRGRYRRSSFMGSATVDAQPIDEYTAFADILVFEGEKPDDDVNAYDARDVLGRLRGLVIRAGAE